MSNLRFLISDGIATVMYELVRFEIDRNRSPAIGQRM
jgi:hypothetical protein